MTFEQELVQILNQIPGAIEKAFTAFVERHPGHANQKTHGNRFGGFSATKESLRRLKDDKGARERYKAQARKKGAEKVTVPQGKESDYARGLLIAVGKKDRNKAGIITSAAKGSDFMKSSGREQEYIDRLTGAAKQAGLSDAEILAVAQGAGGGKSRVTSEQLRGRRKQAESLLRQHNQKIAEGAGKKAQPKPQPKPKVKPESTQPKSNTSSRLDELLGDNFKTVNLGKAQGKTGEIEFQLAGGTKRDPDTLQIVARKVGSGDKWHKVHWAGRDSTLGEAVETIKQRYGWEITPNVSGNPHKPKAPKKPKKKPGYIYFNRGRS